METITNKMAVRNDYFLKGGRLKAVKSEQTTYVRIPYHVTYQGLPGYKTVAYGAIHARNWTNNAHNTHNRTSTTRFVQNSQAEDTT